jgi:hypothetical protein
MSAQTTKIPVLESYSDSDIFLFVVTSPRACVVVGQSVVFVDASSVAVATVPTKAHKNATGNQYGGGCPYIRRQGSKMKMGYQEACSRDTKQDQSSCILHQPACCDGYPQK